MEGYLEGNAKTYYEANVKVFVTAFQRVVTEAAEVKPGDLGAWLAERHFDGGAAEHKTEDVIDEDSSGKVDPNDVSKWGEYSAEGSFGKMWTAQHKGSVVLLEELLCWSDVSASSQRLALEAHIINTTVHPLAMAFGRTPNFPRYIGLLNTEASIYSVYDHPGYSPLELWASSLPSRKERPKINQVWSLLEQMSAALVSLHSQGVCHGHVHAANVILSSQEATSFTLWDAGLRFAFENEVRSEVGEDETLVRKEKRRDLDRRESLSFYVLDSKYEEICPFYGQRSDLYALGVCVQQFLGCFKEAFTAKRPANAPHSIWKVVDTLLDVDASPDVTANQIHKMVTSITSMDTADGVIPQSDFVDLEVPFISDRLSFIQYNVPLERREIAEELSTQDAYKLDLCIKNADKPEAISGHLTEAARAVAYSTYCTSLSIKIFSVDGTQISAEVSSESVLELVAAMERCEAMQHLSMDRVGLDSEVFQDAVSRLWKVLRGFGYSGTQIGRPFAADAALHGLTELRLPQTQLTDEIVEALVAEECRLEIIDFSSNKLTEKTGVVLARQVAKSTSLKTLLLASNRLGDATLLAFAEAFKQNTTVAHFDMQSNGAKMKSVAEMSLTLEHRPHLSCYTTQGLFAFKMKV